MRSISRCPEQTIAIALLLKLSSKGRHLSFCYRNILGLGTQAYHATANSLYHIAVDTLGRNHLAKGKLLLVFRQQLILLCEQIYAIHIIYNVVEVGILIVHRQRRLRPRQAHLVGSIVLHRV